MEVAASRKKLLPACGKLGGSEWTVGVVLQDRIHEL